MKIAICDDEQPVLNQLHKFINKYALDNLFDYTILEFNKSERLLEAASQDPDIKILFLDIYMSPLSGMDLADILRANGNDCAIIFVTVSTEHYARSYEINAVHYLVKPVTYDRVKMALDRCEQVLTGISCRRNTGTLYGIVHRNRPCMSVNCGMSVRRPQRTGSGEPDAW